MRGKKRTHLHRVAGIIASIRGKKPHVYRVIILKQMAYHIKIVNNKKKITLKTRCLNIKIGPKNASHF